MIIPSESVSFHEFINSMRTDYNSAELIPIVDANEDWRAIGNFVASSPLFISRGVPTTESFPNWQEWGIIVYDRMMK